MCVRNLVRHVVTAPATAFLIAVQAAHRLEEYLLLTVAGTEFS